MANISWTSSSINSFFNTSLGNPTSAFGSLYSSLGDASLIKRGTYHKLMEFRFQGRYFQQNGYFQGRYFYR